MSADNQQGRIEESPHSKFLYRMSYKHSRYVGVYGSGDNGWKMIIIKKNL